MLLFLACVIFDVPRVFFSAREKARQTTCLSNMKEIAGVLLLYSQDWDETFPPAKHWADASALHIKPAEIARKFHCDKAPSPYSYVFNVHLNRLRLETLEEPAQTPAIYEGSAFVFNAAGDGITIPLAKRHGDGGNMAHADGHVKYRSLSSALELNWQHKSVPQNKASKP